MVEESQCFFVNLKEGQNSQELLMVEGSAVAYISLRIPGIRLLGEKCGQQELNRGVEEPSTFLMPHFFSDFHSSLGSVCENYVGSWNSKEDF